MTPLRALVAVPHDNDARKLARFLDDHGCHTTLATQGDEALTMVRTARGKAEPFELLLADHRLHVLDGLSLINEVHRIEPGATGCLLIDTHRIDDRLRSEARGLGCRHLVGIPIDFGKLQSIVERLHRQRGSGTASYNPTRSATDGGEDSPFFGTRRLAPGTGRRSTGTGRIETGTGGFTPPQGGHHQDDPVDDSGVFDSALKPQPVPETQREQSHLYRSMEDTGRVTRRRTVGGTFDPNPRQDPTTQRRAPVTGAFDEPHASPTQRIRRGVTGRIDRDRQDEEVRQATNRITRSSAKVACAHCGQAFAVVRKDQAYTMPCIHCGGINTVSP